jgi:uncharacterized membrane protein
MNRRLLTAVMLGCFVVGVLVMVVLELAIGVVLLFAFIVLGVFLIADPAFLGEEDG